MFISRRKTLSTNGLILMIFTSNIWHVALSYESTVAGRVIRGDSLNLRKVRLLRRTCFHNDGISSSTLSQILFQNFTLKFWASHGGFSENKLKCIIYRTYRIFLTQFSCYTTIFHIIPLKTDVIHVSWDELLSSLFL